MSGAFVLGRIETAVQVFMGESSNSAQEMARGWPHRAAGATLLRTARMCASEIIALASARPAEKNGAILKQKYAFPLGAG